MVTLFLLASWLLFTDADIGPTSRTFSAIFVHGMVDELRGAPSASALEPSAHFDEAGIAFDYPAVLRRRDEVDDDGSRTYSLEYGMFTIELHAPTHGVDSALYLGAIVDVFEGGTRIDAEGPMPGRGALLCGEQRTATRIRLKMMGDWSEMEGFDLPSPDAHPRLLVFDDETLGQGNTPLALAAYERVFATLRCAGTRLPGAADAGDAVEQ